MRHSSDTKRRATCADVYQRTSRHRDKYIQSKSHCNRCRGDLMRDANRHDESPRCDRPRHAHERSGVRTRTMKGSATYTTRQAAATNNIQSGVTPSAIAAVPAIAAHMTGMTKTIIGAGRTTVSSSAAVKSVVGQGTAKSGARGTSWPDASTR